ncbi:pheromone-binding protein Gp-9-like [Nylanderia fulva]|uniref:pheromone-binding protein Gp-9-like n=1 Tax=Nylanderia fulva TaxID=613905 RepID=UPI0010FB7EFF|nr:pheromone-binding protein Gp-9-like [Nylanderia fulva]
MKVICILCICVLGFIVVLAQSELKQQLKNAVTSNIQDEILTCLTENNLTVDNFYSEVQIMTGVHARSENEEKTRNHGCAIACVLKKSDLMENSNIDERKLHVKINQELSHSPHQVRVHKVARDCIKEVKNITEECEKCFSLFTCVIKTAHKLEKHEEHVRTATEGNEEAEHEEHEKAETEENTETE